MIIWLASYPRSGNTMLRMLLKQAFGIQSYSVYNDPFDLGKDAGLSEHVGHENLSQNREEFIAAAKVRDDLQFIKTHEAPSDSSKAIYVIRDGRAAIVSLWHWLRDVKKDPHSIENVICGNLALPSWSEHYEAWAPETRADTLFLRYEETRDWSPALVARIADFIGVEPKAAAANNFASMQALAPTFFRKGDNEANIAELTGPSANLFWLLHGAAMVKLGYVPSAPRLSATASRRAILQFRDRAREMTFTQELRNTEIEHDRQARLEGILAREAELARIKAEYLDIAERYVESEADREARLQGILEREVTLARLRAELEGLSARYVESEADRAARLDLIVELGNQVIQLQDELKTLSEKYIVSEADRQARLEVIYERERVIVALQNQLAALREATGG